MFGIFGGLVSVRRRGGFCLSKPYLPICFPGMTRCLNMIPGELSESGLEMGLEGDGELPFNLRPIPNDFEES
jgi:hypothetical protein